MRPSPRTGTWNQAAAAAAGHARVVAWRPGCPWREEMMMAGLGALPTFSLSFYLPSLSLSHQAARQAGSPRCSQLFLAGDVVARAMHASNPQTAPSIHPPRAQQRSLHAGHSGRGEPRVTTRQVGFGRSVGSSVVGDLCGNFVCTCT